MEQNRNPRALQKVRVARAFLAIMLIASGFSLVLKYAPPAYATSCFATNGILIPLYNQHTGSTWASVISLRSTYPNVPISVIVNQANGVRSNNATYATAITNLQSHGIIVYGYDWTNYGESDSAFVTFVQNNMSDWNSFYHVNGTFFDGMRSTTGAETLYTSYVTYSHAHSLPLTIGNPGTAIATSYNGIMNNIVTWESGSMPDPTTLHNDYISAAGTQTLSYIANNVALPSEATVDATLPYVTLSYITNVPYTTGLPSYISTEMTYLNDYNDCTTSTSSSSSTPSTITSTTTVTVTGILAPDSAHLANSIVPIMFPLGGMFFVLLGTTFMKIKGDFQVTLALGGLFIGCLIADLPASGSGTSELVPFAMTAITGIFLAVWLYQGGQSN